MSLSSAKCYLFLWIWWKCGSPMGKPRTDWVIRMWYFVHSTKLFNGTKETRGRRAGGQGGTVEEHCNSPLEIPHCKYTSKTHPKLWQDVAPALASFMNVTPRERKMITLQRRQGAEQEGVGERKKKNHFDGLCPSWDNLVTFLDRILTCPDSLLRRRFSFFSSVSFCHLRHLLALTTAPDMACR